MQDDIDVIFVIYVIYVIYDMYGALTYTICMYVNMGPQECNHLIFSTKLCFKGKYSIGFIKDRKPKFY